MDYHGPLDLESMDEIRSWFMRRGHRPETNRCGGPPLTPARFSPENFGTHVSVLGLIRFQYHPKEGRQGFSPRAKSETERLRCRRIARRGGSALTAKKDVVA
jgi:hypothetical protein